MGIVVSVIVAVGLVVILWAFVLLIRRMFPGGSSPVSGLAEGAPPPYGGQPGLGPVGPLGGLSPDASIDDLGSPDDLLGG